MGDLQPEFEVDPPDDRPCRDWFLERETELRLEVDDTNKVDIQVKCVYLNDMSPAEALC